jgi:broad specificity phosphatase PhoE
MLILIRHGESTGNAAGLLVGRADLPLTEHGRWQAAALGAPFPSAKVGKLVTSPLTRARDTAALLALGPEVPTSIDPRWIEVDYGEYDAKPLGAVSEDVWSRWRADPSFRPPGGETLAEVGARVREACEELFATSGAGARGEGDVVVVSHVSPIKAAVCWALGVGDQWAWRLQLATASVTRIDWGMDGPRLLGFNDTLWRHPSP